MPDRYQPARRHAAGPGHPGLARRVRAGATAAAAVAAAAREARRLNLPSLPPVTHASVPLSRPAATVPLPGGPAGAGRQDLPAAGEGRRRVPETTGPAEGAVQ